MRPGKGPMLRIPTHPRTEMIGSLCSGYGGLDLAVSAITGSAVAWVSDIDEPACRVLASRFPTAENLGDVTHVDWPRVRRVEWLTAGYPCQPFSWAVGRTIRKGIDDARYIWPSIVAAIRDIRPAYVFLENVPGHRSLGFGTVLGDLAALRYVGSWISLRAQDAGAPHKRERVFILARNTDGMARSLASARQGGSGPVHQSGKVWRIVRPDSPPLDVWGRYEPAVSRWQMTAGHPVPAALMVDAPGGRQLNAELPEWMMGLPRGWVTGTPGITNIQALSLCGNGVVPQQAALALTTLLARPESVSTNDGPD